MHRRDFMRLSSLGVFGASLSGWLAPLAARAAVTKAKTKSCILLWMDGGPSHKDTFDMKPGTANGGEFKPIKTAASGIEISEHLPKVAGLMSHAVILRSMSTQEGAHGRAKVYLHTGYKEGVGGLVYPSMGSIVSKELGNPEFPLPNFVTIGNRSYGAGFLGPKHQPLTVSDPARGVESLKTALTEGQFHNRLGLLEEMEAGFYKQYQASAANDHRTTYQRAVRLMESKEAKAFDLDKEPASGKAGYGSDRFAQGCLLARRLVETGVPFVECNLGGWDTHQNNFERVKTLSQQVDGAMSALISDLKDRGMLESTLVVWMGEFGRTPKINSRGDKPGRDHYPKAWSSVLFGGGIKGGQAIGKTDAEGATVTERPISAMDFMATVTKILAIDYRKQYETPIGRPIGIADRGAKPVEGIVYPYGNRVESSEPKRQQGITSLALGLGPFHARGFLYSHYMAKSPKFTFHPVTPERWPDLEKLFGERGACGGCWCMAWRLKRADWLSGKGELNKLALQTIVERDDQPGVLAYVGDEPIGWISVAPREVFVALGRSRILAPVDETPVWSISCLFVAKPYRRQGVSVKLIDAAVKFAAKQGATAVEAYPYVPYAETMPAAFAWTGIASAFEQAGFTEVARRSDKRPIMRRTCG